MATTNYHTAPLFLILYVFYKIIEFEMTPRPGFNFESKSKLQIPERVHFRGPL
jgi:hypothetical protein